MKNRLFRYSKLLLLVTALSLVISSSGCVSVRAKPHEKIVSNGEMVQCTHRFPEWELGVETPQASCGSVGSEQEMAACLALFGVVVPVGSTIVSGSIYLVGNTLHWIEKQAYCTDFW
ncbi:hypothetical protein [Oceanobacter mangrovi]|uniref:hypothetical protein n=1 Tax=Oceanobacter mangrovi TaxID=2862510 RepID=UPI001C8CF826|nr:hypothetical protein [Oceanobacter mangrovi]